MRLPAVTPQQKQREDSRQFCETLYGAFLAEHCVMVRTAPDRIARQQRQVASNTRHFWKERGFLLHTAQSEDQALLRVWIAPGESLKRRKRAA